MALASVSVPPETSSWPLTSMPRTVAEPVPKSTLELAPMQTKSDGVGSLTLSPLSFQLLGESQAWSLAPPVQTIVQVASPNPTEASSSAPTAARTATTPQRAIDRRLCARAADITVWVGRARPHGHGSLYGNRCAKLRSADAQKYERV